MNKFIGLYFATVINANQYRFSYGRKANQKKISELEIELPIKIDGTCFSNIVCCSYRVPLSVLWLDKIRQTNARQFFPDAVDIDP